MACPSAQFHQEVREHIHFYARNLGIEIEPPAMATVSRDHRTSWYHSHYSAQYGDGVVGPIVIAGPATSNYDVDLGAMPINDWCKIPPSLKSHLILCSRRFKC